jgi:Response regulator containing a CheY-like receiver domain and an HTH DNA-binding domain
MTKAIIVDDHELFRIGIKGTLMGSDVSIIGEADCGEQLFSLLNTLKPDLIFLDIILPDISGIDIAQRMRSEYPDIKILVLSAENTEDVVQKLVEIGIDGFVSKRQCTTETLSQAVQSIMSGVNFFGKDISVLIKNIYVAKKKTTCVSTEFTERECEIITLSHKGLQCKAIADLLGISPRTVDTHKNNIFKKLGINSTYEMIQYAVKNGIISLSD